MPIGRTAIAEQSHETHSADAEDADDSPAVGCARKKTARFLQAKDLAVRAPVNTSGQMGYG
jgi:hypothetical protein